MKLKEFVENNKGLTLIEDICLHFTYRVNDEPYTLDTLVLKGYYGDYEHNSNTSTEEYLKIFEDRELSDAYAFEDSLYVEIIPNDFEKELIKRDLIKRGLIQNSETIDKQNQDKKLDNEDED